ncbi:MAG: tRNA (N(6)-L-threonylcarbamoyladenosine(37)-C(2))-methylthiotransferase MtaB [Caldilineaceae bacterium]
MHIFVDQLGCRLNYGEMEMLAGRLQAVGHQIIQDAAQAQVIVFNSCAVTADAVRSSRKQVRHFHKINPHARIAVTGCWATLQPAEALALPGVALVANNEQKDLLHLLLEPWSAELDDPEDLLRIQPNGTPFPEKEQKTRRSRTRAFIKVQDGCNNKCTFCIVTLARGQSRSRSIATIVKEIQQLVADGLQEAVLTGVHLGSYGRDLAGAERTDLKALVAAILTDTDIPRLRLSSLEPWELAAGFFDLWQQWPGRLCPHLHLPLQAGTDRQLRQMARRCTVATFRQLVQDARAAIPDLIVTTDLIAGFPGETDTDFHEGLAFVEEMRFAHAHIFPFSARAGTAASTFADQVPTVVKKERAQQLRAVVEQTGQWERQRFLGAVRPVLWEGEGQPLADQPGRLWSGLTDNYLRVTTVVDETVDLHNVIKVTKLVGLDYESLNGMFIIVGDADRNAGG